jgi:hypothetical protein
MGRRFVQTSLRTRDARVAKVYAQTLSLRCAQVFAELRGTAVPKPPRVDDIVAGAQQGSSRAYEMDVDPATLRPTRIRTDGTPQDNQAVLDALQALGNLRVVLAQPLPDLPPGIAGGGEQASVRPDARRGDQALRRSRSRHPEAQHLVAEEALSNR